MGIISSIKAKAANSGSNKEKILYVKSDSKVRVRFLQELDDGYEFVFHDSYAEGINTICREELGKNCPLCGNEDLRTRSLYCWSVYNYDTKKVEVMLYAVNRCTPVQSLVQLYEQYGTMMDRDYVLSKTGKAQETTFTVLPQDKQKFRNTKATPYTKSAILKILSKAYPYEDEFEEDEDIVFEEEELDDFEEDEENINIKKKSKKKTKQEEDESNEYAMVDEDEVEESFNPTARKRKNKSNKEEAVSKNISVDDMQTILEEEDIDEDDFLEYIEKSKLDKVKCSKKKFKKLVKEYLDYIEEDEE